MAEEQFVSSSVDRRKSNQGVDLLVPYLESMQDAFTRVHNDMQVGFKENREGIGNVHRRMDDIEGQISILTTAQALSNKADSDLQATVGILKLAHDNRYKVLGMVVGASTTVGAICGWLVAHYGEVRLFGSPVIQAIRP